MRQQRKSFFLKEGIQTGQFTHQLSLWATRGREKAGTQTAEKRFFPGVAKVKE